MGSGIPHKVTDITKAEVSALKCFGIINEDIAKYLGISSDTLTKYYRDELELAQSKANVEIASKLYKKALAGDVTCMIFWLKTRARWSTTGHDATIKSNEKVKNELKEIRLKLAAQYKKDY